MDITINRRGNGACPLCKRMETCPIRREIIESLKKVNIRKISNTHPVEAVIYACPAFEEE